MKNLTAIGFLLAVASVPASANVLTFDGAICSGGHNCANFAAIDNTYGDVAGVVDVQYRNVAGGSGESNLLFWTTDYSDLVNVAYTSSNDNNSVAEIFLKPLDGQGITLNSFDLGAWADTARRSQYTILDGASNVLFSSGVITVGNVTTNAHNHFAINLFSADGIRIQWGPSAYNVGIDNVDFTTGIHPVPLPAAAWLLAPALGMLGLRRRAA